MRRFVERVDSNPWIHEWRRVKTEADRTGDDEPIDDFVRRFKADERRRYLR